MKIVNYSIDKPTQWLSCRSNCEQDTKRNDTIEKLSVHYLNNGKSQVYSKETTTETTFNSN